MGKLSTDELVCENGHRIGFRRGESDGDGWSTLRCIQCGGLSQFQFTCPYCGNKSAFMWFNANNEDNVLIRCTKCEKWITNKAVHISVLKTALKTLPLMALGYALGLGIGYFISHLLGVPNETALLIGNVLGLIIGAFLAFRIGR